MRKTGLLVAAAVALLPLAVPARAQEATPAAVEPARAEAPAPPVRVRPELSPELRHVLDKLDEANASLVDVQARVTYIRWIRLLDDKRKSRGTLIFKKPDLLVLDLKRPRSEEVRTNGRTWWVVSHNDKMVQVYQAATEGEGGREAAFLAFGYGQTSEQLLEDYDVELLSVTPPEDDEDDPTVYRLKFTPVERPDQPARYSAIEVAIGDKLWLPHELVLYERSDEIAHTYELSKLKLNKGVDDDVFEYEPPSKYSVEQMNEP